MFEVDSPTGRKSNLIFKQLFNNMPIYLWYLSVIVVALLISVPIFSVLMGIFADHQDIWQHLIDTVLKDYILNTLYLMLGVTVGVLIIGVGCAWLVTMCEFIGSNILEWLLLMPLAAPAYILAFSYTDMLSYFGPVQTWLRSIFAWESIDDYWFPSIRNMWGAIAMLVLVLYPYVYLLARVAFLEQSVCTLEASRSLGYNPWQSFIKVALPASRPSIVAGLALALMETLNDFGTVQYFGVSTFTTGIYRTWFGMGERVAAAQLASFLMVFIVILIVVERLSRSQARYYQTNNSNQKLPRYSLNFFRGSLAFILCSIPVILGFIIPSIYLLNLTLSNQEETLNDSFWELSKNSFILAIISAFIAIIVVFLWLMDKD